MDYPCEDIFENGTRMDIVGYDNSSNVTILGLVPVDFRHLWLCSVESYLQAQVQLLSQMKFQVLLRLQNQHCPKEIKKLISVINTSPHVFFLFFS